MARRPFDDNLYRFSEAQPSYWEATADAGTVDSPPLAGRESCDVAIIGGGYTGLSAALHLARDYDFDVRVLEAGHIGWGASGRNGGFCTTGGTGVHRQELVRLVGLDKAREYYGSQVEAVELVRGIVADAGIDCQPQGSAEIEVAHTPRAFARLQADHGLLTRSLGLEADIFTAAETAERFYTSTETCGALVTRPTFALHPLRYCIGLANAATASGARLHATSEVVEWGRGAAGTHRLVTPGGALSAKRVVFATNGFMPEHLHEGFSGRTIPVISAIIVTRPLTDDELARQNWRTRDPVINARRILNYFRLLPDKRFLFGGRGDVIGSPQRERRTYAGLEARLRAIWPAWSSVDVEYRWHGLICLTASLCPAIGRLQDEPGVWFGFGYHGNGVNTATWAGKQLATWIGSGREPATLPAIVRGAGKRYPFPALRKSYLRFALFVSRQLDRFG